MVGNLQVYLQGSIKLLLSISIWLLSVSVMLLWLVSINFFLNLATMSLVLVTDSSFTILDTLLFTTNELILGANLVTWRTLDTLLPVSSLDTLWLGMNVLSTEVDWLVFTTESSLLVLVTDTDLLLSITELAWSPLGTETSLLLSNTELSLDKLDTLLNVSLLLGKSNQFTSNTLLGLDILVTNLVALLSTESTEVNISPSLVMLLGNLLPVLFTLTDLLIVGTVSIQLVLSTLLLVVISNFRNIDILGTDGRTIKFGTDKVIGIFIAGLVGSLVNTQLLPRGFDTILFFIVLGTDLLVTMTQTQTSGFGILVALAKFLVFQTDTLTNNLPITTFLLGTDPLVIRTLALHLLVMGTLLVAELLMIRITINSFFSGTDTQDKSCQETTAQ